MSSGAVQADAHRSYGCGAALTLLITGAATIGLLFAGLDQDGRHGSWFGPAAPPADWGSIWLIIGAIWAIVITALALVESRRSERRTVNLQQMEELREKKLRALTLSQIDTMTGVEFERYLQRVLRTRGYEAELTKASNDLGVDLILAKDGDRIAVQVKRYGTAISRRAISDAVAGMQHYRCTKAMVVTSNYFTRGARTLATSTSCMLVDRDLLTEWICDYNGRTEERADSASRQVRIILCPRCEQCLRIPEIYKTLRVRCSTCRHQFVYPSQ